MKKNILAAIAITLLVLPVLAANLVFAQDSIVPKADPTLGGEIATAGKMSAQPIDQTLNTVANYAIGILVITSIFYVIWAGYMFVMYGTDPEKVGEARKKIMFAGIGIIVALMAKGIVSLILSAING